MLGQLASPIAPAFFRRCGTPRSDQSLWWSWPGLPTTTRIGRYAFPRAICYTKEQILFILDMEVFSFMALIQDGQWPNYTYIVPQIYTQARVRLVGLGTYAPKGVITNDFFAYISTRLGDPRKADDLERVTGLKTRYVRASTLDLCRKMAGEDAPGLIADPDANPDESLVGVAVAAVQRAIASAGLDISEIDTVIGASSSDNDAFPTIAAMVQMRLGLGPIRATMLKGACACQTEGFQTAVEALVTSTARRV